MKKMVFGTKRIVFGENIIFLFEIISLGRLLVWYINIQIFNIKFSKIGLRHVLSWPKLDLVPKCHDPGTFGGFGKRGQTFIR